ncbi:MAG: DUF4349 domain-containing protein [Lewinellaceae bacterium]|nr:DUF4349 domain-containing protein [Lewinellaceae bacterium]
MTGYPLKKIILWLAGLFLLMFGSRLAYGYLNPGKALDGQIVNIAVGSGNEEDYSVSRKNYASEKIKQSGPAPEGPSGSGQTQKYEKVASLRSQSSRFSEDESQLKTAVKNFGAIIQFEQNTGNAGYRNLHLIIGVQPEKFDSFYLNMQDIGKIISKSVTKTDKTNEYLQLNAKRISLEKTRNSLLELKNRGGNIDEYIGLENRILEIEEQLQGLGVQLGDYDEENEFCTVRFSLYEGEEVHIGLAQRLKVAFEWTVKFYTLLMLGLCFALGAAFLGLRIIGAIRGRDQNLRN